jgi:hypothetical protein
MKPINQAAIMKTGSKTLVALFFTGASLASATPVRQVPGFCVATFLARGDNAAPATVFNSIHGDLQPHTTMGKTGLDAVTETNKTNNTAASPPITALP